MQTHREIAVESINALGVRNQALRKMKAVMKDKDAIIAGYEADRAKFQGKKHRSL